MTTIDTIIFDLGGVLIDWNPEYVYLKLFNGNKKKTTWFLNNICTFEWNEQQDAGKTIAESTQELVERFPEYKNEIETYYHKWEHMLGGAIQPTVKVLKKLIEQKKYKIVALTNWSAETFPIALQKFDFLHWFEGIVVSGKEQTRKPFEKIYHITLNRFNIKPERALFIDDNPKNVETAKNLKINGILFHNASQMEEDFKAFGVEII